MDGGQYLGVAEVAQALGRSTEQVRRYLREGRLPGQRIGGQWFVRAADLSGFQETQRDQQSFLHRLKPAATTDPLGMVIGIGAGGGSNIANGRDAYRRGFWWRR
jgi:excisionase family DNA binding protein